MQKTPPDLQSAVLDRCLEVKLGHTDNLRVETGIHILLQNVEMCILGGSIIYL